MYDPLQELVNELEATCDPKVQQKLSEVTNGANSVEDIITLYDEVFGK